MIWNFVSSRFGSDVMVGNENNHILGYVSDNFDSFIQKYKNKKENSSVIKKRGIVKRW